MRSSALFLLSASCSLLIPGCSCNRDDNLNIQPDPDEVYNDIGSWLGMELMPSGKPAVSYHDKTKGGLGFAIGTIGETEVKWELEEVDGYPSEDGLNPGTRGTHTDLAIASDGTVHISYRDESNKGLRHAKRSPDGTWELGIGGSGSGASPDIGEWSSIVLDATENPIISYYDKGAGALRVSHYTGTGFSSEVVDEGGVGEYSDLLLVDGIEYIAYYDATNGDLKLAVGQEGSYTTEVVDSEGNVGKWPSLAMQGDNFVIAYQDVDNQDLLFATGSPGAWTTEIALDGDYQGADNEVVFLNGSPAIYTHDGHNNDLLLVEQSEAAWTTGTVAGDEAALGFHVETVENNGSIYVASYDYTNRFLFFAIKD